MYFTPRVAYNIRTREELGKLKWRTWVYFWIPIIRASRNAEAVKIYPVMSRLVFTATVQIHEVIRYGSFTIRFKKRNIRPDFRVEKSLFGEEKTLMALILFWHIKLKVNERWPREYPFIFRTFMGPYTMRKHLRTLPDSGWDERLIN